MISSLQSISPAVAGIALPASGAGEVLLIASAGLIGMGLSDLAGGLFGDDEDVDDDADDGGDFAGEGTTDDDALDGDLGGNDDLDDLDGWDDDDDLGGNGGDAASELEPRLDELENEVASISSSMGTVRSENEAINETVDEIEDNIRKLLDIYEMVTRGVNPFVDDVQGGGGGGMEGSFGLFDDAASPDDGTDELDPDVANADPDDFFDDDFDDEPADDFDDELDDEIEEDGADDAQAQADAQPDDEAASPEADDGGDAGGKTFDDLKSEYQAGDAEWEEDGSTGAEASLEASTAAEESADDAGVPEPDTSEPSESVEPEPELDEDDDAADTSQESGSDRDGKPYLHAIPGGYASELLVIEWLTYLRDESGTAEALRAIRYYESIGWIGGSAAETLQQYLTGLGTGEQTDTVEGETRLSIDHHTNSLRYIGRLGGADIDVERLDWGGSSPARNRIERRGQRGIQR